MQQISSLMYIYLKFNLSMCMHDNPIGINESNLRDHSGFFGHFDIQ